ncbi:hypothetical protein T492DRAFT_969851 [Pavlovales sp. CCMP2436]|nr:hypothetical protein T492DRAFT_969851 [Pavlovales sp. CCMP2436]
MRAQPYVQMSKPSSAAAAPDAETADEVYEEAAPIAMAAMPLRRCRPASARPTPRHAPLAARLQAHADEQQHWGAGSPRGSGPASSQPPRAHHAAPSRAAGVASPRNASAAVIGLRAQLDRTVNRRPALSARLPLPHRSLPGTPRAVQPTVEDIWQRWHADY